MNKPKKYAENKNQGVSHANGHLVISETYEGQIPSPEMMEKYNKLDPTFANRILMMAEKEQNNAHKISNKTANSFIVSLFLGMFFAFSSVLVVSYLVYLCIEKGYPTAASSIAIGVIVGVAGVFLYQRKKNKAEQNT